jgi:hypothetical protein
VIVNAVTCRTIEARRSRRRRTETIRLRMAVPVEIREVGAGETRLAARIVSAIGQRSDFKACDGAFVERIPGEAIRGGGVLRYFDGTLFGARPAFGLYVGDGGVGRSAALLPAVVDEDVREIVSDDGEERAAEVRREAAAHLVVDGELWRPAEEPVWQVARMADSEPAPLRAVSGREDDGSAVFRLDRADEADRYVREIHRFRRRRYQIASPKVDVLEFEPRFDDRLHSAAALGRRVVDTLPGKAWLHLLPSEAILRWCDLREAVAAGRDAEAIVRGAGRLLSEIGRLDLNRNGEEDRQALLRSLHEPLLRWTGYEDGRLDGAGLDAVEDDAVAALVGAP